MRAGTRIFISIFLLVTVMTTAGCTSSTADDLYSLPKASKEFLQLQKQIDTVLDSGAEYSPPTAGPNRQSVQLKDIDGDGQNEAIAFFRMTGDKPLKIYIMKQIDGTYETVCKIEGSGTAIESIRYADMDSDNISELVVGWQSSGLAHMMIYSVRDNQPVLLAESDYSKLVTSDLDDDGATDVIALRLPTPEVPGGADMFSLRPDGQRVTSSALLSADIASITRIFKSRLTDGTSALFVEGSYQGSNVSVITDILCSHLDSIINVFVTGPGESSEETVRAQSVYSADINNDGIFEVPSPRLLPSEENKTYFAIDWFAYSQSGSRQAVFTTYHDYQEGWYLILPAAWIDHITVRREDSVAGERTIIFTWLPDGQSGDLTAGTDFLKIYTLSGDNKEDRARLGGRSILLLHGDVIYAGEVLTPGDALGVTWKTVTGNFGLIPTEWATGGY